MEKWIRTLRRFARNKKAISGLETAIVLIAFVIVASAFAYAVLNMGFLATQKSQEVAMGGLQAASSAVVLDGPVYGYSTETGAGARLTSVMFWLKTASGADSVDLNPGKTTIAFQNARGIWPNIYQASDKTADIEITAGGVLYKAVYDGTDDTAACLLNWEVGSGYLLDRGEKVRVTVALGQLQTDVTMTAPDGSQIPATETGLVIQNEQLKIIVKPPTGSVLDIVRYAPPEVKTVNDLG